MRLVAATLGEGGMLRLITATILGWLCFGSGSASAQAAGCAPNCAFYHNYGPYDLSYIRPGLVGVPVCDRDGNCQLRIFSYYVNGHPAKLAVSRSGHAWEGELIDERDNFCAVESVRTLAVNRSSFPALARLRRNPHGRGDRQVARLRLQCDKLRQDLNDFLLCVGRFLRVTIFPVGIGDGVENNSLRRPS